MVERTKWAAFFGAAVIVATLVVIAFIRLCAYLDINGPLLLFLGFIIFALIWIYDALTERPG